MSYAGAAANIVGGELQGWAALLDREAMQQAFRDEMGRQRGFRDIAGGVFDAGLSQQGSAAALGQMASGQVARQDAYNRLGATPLGLDVAGQGSKSAARDAGLAQIAGYNRAKLGSYGDWQHQSGIDSMATQRLLNQIASQAQGQAQVFPYRMYEAQHSMDALAQIGAMISSIGGGAANFSQYNQTPQMNNLYGYGNVPQGTWYNPSTDQSMSSALTNYWGQ